MTSAQRRAFVAEQTVVSTTALVPEVRLHLATEATTLWQATQDLLDLHDLPPPFWAFAWPGGQALARYLLESPEVVAGRRVLSFAAGSAIEAIAAAQAGAHSVIANEIDSFAVEAIALNAALNGVSLEIEQSDLIGSHDPSWQVVIAGDVCYEKPMAERVTAWLSSLARAGVTVLSADPGRTYLPGEGLYEVARYDVPTSLELEDRTMRSTAIYRWTA